MCIVATVINRIMVFYSYGNGIHVSIYTLFWLWFTIIPDLFVLLVLYTLLFRIGSKYPRFEQYGIVISFIFAVCILLVSSCNIIMLTAIGQNMEWKIIFDVNLSDTYSLYVPYTSLFLRLLACHFILGGIFWFIINYYNLTHNVLRDRHFKTIKIVAIGFILTYILIVVFYRIPQPYKSLSSNMVLTYIPEIFTYYRRTTLLIPIDMDESAFDIVIPEIRAPAVNISRPRTVLKKPIKHVFIMVLESIRADALPLNKKLSQATRASFQPNTTADNVTPFFNLLWMNSIRTVASVTSSYTLKSLLSIFCGIYPLNTNFLSEINTENIFYKKCLPELLRETFRTKNNRSPFRSAFFTAARDDFDHQRELFNNIKFDTVINGFDIYNEFGNLSDLNPFGPADPNILPLMWKWIDNNLAEKNPKQLMMSLLVTGTHSPFQIPDYWHFDKYRYYTDNGLINDYLNTMRINDDFLKEIIDGFKSRKLYNETLFVIVSDHGYTFNDYGTGMVGLVNNPLECALLVPLILYNPHLEAKQIDGQFTNMDILPTIMDILLSSTSTRQSTNRLLSVPRKQLKSILSQYEGTSILRMPIKKQPVRYTFHLASPGNCYIIVKQYPKKLTYDIVNDEVHLYHLIHDPFELVDLITINYYPTESHPEWIYVLPGEDLTRTWKQRWISKTTTITIQNQILSQNKSLIATSRFKAMNNSKVRLRDMLDWADQTLELARLWNELVRLRYRNGSQISNKYKKRH